jgi:ABC-type glycerol-3-phosphate transport system substrate-binding protein
MLKRLSLVVLMIAAIALMIAPTASAQDVKVVSFLTTFGGSELDALNQCLNAFSDQSGVLVTVESNRQSMPILRTRIAGAARRTWR